MVTQVLVDWLWLPPENRSWEYLESVTQSVPTAKLEDKLCHEEEGDVTILLDLNETTTHLKEDLTIDDVDSRCDIARDEPSHVMDRSTFRQTQSQARPNKAKDFVYY